MATTVVFLCVAGMRSSRIGGFPAPDEPLDAAGRDVGNLALEARFRANVAISPMLAAGETAEAMGLGGVIDGALADIDYGRWAGRSFEDVHAAEGEAFARWMGDPTGAYPGGEDMSSVSARIGAWLDVAASRGGSICAITHPTVIRAALAHALGLPLAATLAIDVAPLSRAVLSHNRHWRLQSIGPVG